MSSAAAVRLSNLVRLALGGTGAVYIELKVAGKLLGGADDVRVIVQLRSAGEVAMQVEHKAPSTAAGRGFARALADVLDDKVFVEDRIEQPRDAVGVTKPIGQIGQERVAAALADETARDLAAKIKAWVEERLGAPMRDAEGSFYAPSEWKARGEKHGHGAVLVIVHDGSVLSPFCNYDYCQYDEIEAFSAFLGSLGYYCEDQSGWYSGIYPVS